MRVLVKFRDKEQWTNSVNGTSTSFRSFALLENLHVTVKKRFRLQANCNNISMINDSNYSSSMYFFQLFARLTFKLTYVNIK